jgi:colanic acid/amylovoran biosynthesis glycosyltransferase
LKHGDLFLPVSEVFRQRLIDLGCDPAKVFVHRMGIDCGRFTFRARSPADDGVTRLVSVSRLVEKKGIEYAIRAVAALTRRGRRIVYTVIGEGPLGQHLADLVTGLGAGDSVRLVGKKPQPEVIAILDSSHLVVAPSVVAADGDVEGTPAVLMEAMAMGLPAIATRHSGIPEVVEDGVSGMLVPERDVEELAGAIAQMADHPERWPAFGRAGRERVLEQHNIETLNDSLVATYRRVMSQRPRSE